MRAPLIRAIDSEDRLGARQSLKLRPDDQRDGTGKVCLTNKREGTFLGMYRGRYQFAESGQKAYLDNKYLDMDVRETRSN